MLRRGAPYLSPYEALHVQRIGSVHCLKTSQPKLFIRESVFFSHVLHIVWVCWGSQMQALNSFSLQFFTANWSEFQIFWGECTHTDGTRCIGGCLKKKKKNVPPLKPQEPFEIWKKRENTYFSGSSPPGGSTLKS